MISGRLTRAHRACIKKSPIRAQPRHESSAKKEEPWPSEPVQVIHCKKEEDEEDEKKKKKHGREVDPEERKRRSKRVSYR